MSITDTQQASASQAPEPLQGPDERAARGRAARAAVPRSGHAEWSESMRSESPLALLAEQAKTRVPELVPIRHGRMGASAFAYYRGAALPMASDLASLPRTGLDVQLCGDAHLSNFGGFASPERDMVFDINDFDETSRGPFEWDLKRLAASLEIAGRANGFDSATCNRITTGSVSQYRTALRSFADMGQLPLWYTRLDTNTVVARWGAELGGEVVKQMQRNVEKSKSKDNLRAMAKLVHQVDGAPRFASDPPLLVPIGELASFEEAEHVEQLLHDAYRGYLDSLLADRRHLLESYRVADVARKVVGVGSVGTRAWVALLIGRDVSDPIFLQVKEAEASVLERYAGKSGFATHGQRVIEGQRLMQGQSDILLGWHRIRKGVDGRPHDYYFRQLWDWKASVDVESMSPQTLRIYGEVCGWTLARGHARSGDAIAISAYLGRSDVFDRAIGTFAAAYADQNDRDHKALLDAIQRGELSAQVGV